MAFKSPPAQKKTGKSSAARAQVRIIGGQWKRTPLPVLDAEGLRPTPDRVRETLFNWLTFLFDGDWESRVCLDLFAGSGALGFEAASRGAQRAVLLENHTPTYLQLQANREKLRAEQIELVRSDAMLHAKRLSPHSFDLIFIDPPYQSQLAPAALQLAPGLLKAGGLVYLELPKQQELPACLANWQIVRQDQAGMMVFFLLQAAQARAASTAPVN